MYRILPPKQWQWLVESRVMVNQNLFSNWIKYNLGTSSTLITSLHDSFTIYDNASPICHALACTNMKTT